MISVNSMVMPLNPSVIAAIIGSVASTGQAIARGGPRRQYKWNKKAAEDQNRMNRENQQWLLDQERQLQAEAREYDSPEAQMKRYLAAGLNPHLIYGSGSSAGQAFPIHSGQLPGANVQAPSASYPDIAGGFIGAAQSAAQFGLTQARTVESETNAALKSIQTDIAKTNPMLSPWVAEWVSTSMAETARLKSMEARTWLAQKDQVMNISRKINAEIEALTQKLGLNTVDLEIRNRILESKEFENAVKEVQAQWLKDAQVSPEHIRQGLMLLLTKMLGR